MKKLQKIMLGLLMALAMSVTLSVSSGTRADDDVKYIYYPSNQVYFNPMAKEYYFMENGTWVERTTLPPTVTLSPKGVDVMLSGPNPYVHHSTVIQRYPTTYVVP